MTTQAEDEPPQESPISWPSEPSDAEIPSEKLHGYALHPHHPAGMHKARVFAAALNLERCDWQYLERQILDALPAGDLLRAEPTEFGIRSTIRVTIVGLNDRACPVITAWMTEPDGATRLCTVFVDE